MERKGGGGPLRRVGRMFGFGRNKAHQMVEETIPKKQNKKAASTAKETVSQHKARTVLGGPSSIIKPKPDKRKKDGVQGLRRERYMCKRKKKVNRHHVSRKTKLRHKRAAKKAI